MRLIDIYRAFHLKTEYKLFSSTHGTFFRTDHTIDYNTSFIKFQKTEKNKSFSKAKSNQALNFGRQE